MITQSDMIELDHQYVLNISEQFGYYSYSDPYWHQVFLIYRQLDGMKEGCRLKSYIVSQR